MTDEILKLASCWETLASSGEPIILYGTGNGADKIVDELNRLSIKLSGVTASDGFVRERSFRGFQVTPIAEFEKEFESFTVIVGFGTNREEVIENIKNIAKKHRVLVPCVPVYGDEIINRGFIIKHQNELEEVYNIFADEKSREVFADFLRFEMTGELDYLFKGETDKDEAFFDILKLGDGESYLDLGAYRGDTVDEFLKYTNSKYESICAVEPNKKSFEKLAEHTAALERCEIINAGVSESCGFDTFSAELQGRGNAVSGEGEKCKMISVDSLKKPFTYIKADIEGAEAAMLNGAKNTLKVYKPKLNIAAYHRSEDIFLLPKIIKEINSGYGIYLRHHRYIPCWDLNLYCI